MGMFHAATRKRLKARVLFTGPAKGGKSMSALRLAMALARFEASLAGRSDLRVAAIDTECRSLSKYVGIEYDGMKIKFDVAELAPGAYAPQTFIDLMRSVYKTHDVILIDSTSAEWQGTGGTIDIADKATAKSRSKNSFTEGWKVAGPEHQKFIDEIIACPIHIIATARSKMAYEQSKGADGKTSIIKLGLEPVQRETTPFEFDICVDMDGNRNAFFSGRCPALKDKTINEPGADDWKPFIEWLHEGEDDSQPTTDNIAPEVVPATMTVETSSGLPDNHELVVSIQAKRRNLNLSDSKDGEWANAYQPGATTLNQLSVAHLTDLNNQLTEKMKVASRAKLNECKEATEKMLKPSQAKVNKFLELFKELNGPDYDAALGGSIKKRGGRGPDEWTDKELEEAIEKTEAALNLTNLEAALSTGK